jgi:phage host-nuclease inhibitor protein Gam
MVRNWNDFDNKLKEIALIDIAITEAGRARDLALIGAETRYKDATATRLAARVALVKDLEKFYRANRREAEAGGKKSKEMNFGRAGIRAKAATLKLLRGFKWADVIGAIKENYTQWEQFIRTKESVNKDAVKRSMKPEELDSLGMSLKSGEEFFIETFPEKAAEAA